MKIPKVSKRVGLIIGVFLFLVLAAVPSIYFYSQYQTAQRKLENPDDLVREQNRELIEAVGRLIELPSNEEPTVAVVTDSEKLLDQPFFANAQNDDRVIIYTDAKKAILYRPDTNKIINVDNVTIGDTASASAETTSDTRTVVLRNGTSIVGLTRIFEEDLKTKAPSMTVTDRENAARRTYETSLLVDVEGRHPEELTNLSSVLGISTGRLPAGESTPSSDFLIILGKDAQ